MITPWGETKELREDRLAPGRQRLGREAVLANQRRRLLAATIAAVADRGYARTTIADLNRISGVGRNDFYEQFECKQDCFFAAVDSLYREGMRQVVAGYDGEQDWERSFRAAFAELVELIVSQPAAAHMCVVDVYEAGQAGSERVEAALVEFERLLGHAFSLCEPRAGLPPSVIAAIVGGIQMLVHDRLRRGAQDELPEMMEQLVGWALSFETPPVALRGPAMRARPAAPEPSTDPAERLLVAMAEAAAEKGYQAVSVNELAPRASTSLRTLYENFGGKEQVFLACFDTARDRALAAALGAFSGHSDWPTAMHAVNGAVFAYMASEPAFAKVATIEVLGAGRVALERRDEALQPFARLLQGGYELVPDALPIAAEASAFAVYSLAGRAVAADDAASLSRLGPTATFIELAPFLGSERAAEIASSASPAPTIGA